MILFLRLRLLFFQSITILESNQNKKKKNCEQIEDRYGLMREMKLLFLFFVTNIGR